MKVALLSTSESKGGAAIAARRLMAGLRLASCDCQLFVLRGHNPQGGIVGPARKWEHILSLLSPHLDALPLCFFEKSTERLFSIAFSSTGALKKAAAFGPDVINLHWVNSGFLSVRSIGQIRLPVVWTLHDMWPLTGGCHYSGSCTRYESGCGQCPQLRSPGNHDLSHWVLRRKRRAWSSLHLTLVAPSKWLATCAQRSQLFQDRKVVVIPYGLDTQRFRPLDRSFARRALGIDTDKHFVLFSAWSGSSDPRKGFDLLQESLAILDQEPDFKQNVELMVLGGSHTVQAVTSGFKTHFLGPLLDELSMNLVYSAADAFIAPSREDNLPNTVLEALACGIPCLAFGIGGLPDVIMHKTNGYLAHPYDTNDLAEGIRWLLSSSQRMLMLRQAARQTAESNFPLSLQAARYKSLFEDIMDEDKLRPK